MLGFRFATSTCLSRGRVSTQCAPSSQPRASSPLHYGAWGPRQTRQESRSRGLVANFKPGESQLQADERRLRESARVDERAVRVSSLAAFTQHLASAGDKLVCIEVKRGVVGGRGWS